MINIRKGETDIYIVAPAYSKTGGIELLHQLAFKLKEKKLNVIMAYVDTINENKNYRNPAFDCYIKEAIRFEDIIDNEKSIVIFPEVYTTRIKQIKKSQKVIWWLSVDNYTERLGIIRYIKKYKIKKTLRDLIKGNIDFSKKIIHRVDYHLCQSYYAIDYLKRNGIIDNVIYLSDYLNEIFIKESTTNRNKEKKDIVLYNPKKGYKFTKKLIEKNNKYKWIPIQNLTTEQVKDLLAKSKVYIDFGNHPGKDRFPREAAISGCCVITDKRGSAAFYEDVPIKSKYKIEDKHKNIPIIIKRINECLKKYNDNKKDFEKYVEYIKNEERRFEEDINEIFKIN